MANSLDLIDQAISDLEARLSLAPGASPGGGNKQQKKQSQKENKHGKGGGKHQAGGGVGGGGKKGQQPPNLDQVKYRVEPITGVLLSC